MQQRRGQMPQRLEACLLALAVQAAAQFAEHQREQIQRGELRGERLGGCHADLGPGAREKAHARLSHQTCFPPRCRSRACCSCPSAARMLKRRDRIGRLARLGDGDDQRVGIRHAVAIAILAGDLDVARQAGQALDPVARHQSGVVAGAAGENQHAIGFAQQLLCVDAEQLRHDGLRTDHHLQRRRDRAGLLEDLLLHVVPIRAELDRVGRQVALVHVALRRRTVSIEHAHAVWRDLRDIAFFQIHDLARDLQQRRCVGSGEILAFAQAQQQRRTHARDRQPVRLGCRHDGDRIRADQLRDCAVSGLRADRRSACR